MDKNKMSEIIIADSMNAIPLETVFKEFIFRKLSFDEVDTFADQFSEWFNEEYKKLNVEETKPDDPILTHMILMAYLQEKVGNCFKL